jgi:excisionase family DNA binding protein
MKCSNPKQSKPVAPTVNVRLLTIKDAATYLSAHVWFLRTLVWERRIPFLKLGNRLLFDRVDLDAFVESQKTVR